MNKPMIATGMTLVIVGVLALLGASGVLGVTMEMLWPLSILVPGVYLELVYFMKKGKFDGVILIPAAMLITYSILFLAAAWNTASLVFIAWPVFPLGAGLGFLQAHYFGRKNMVYLVIGQTLGIFSLVGLLFVATGVSTEGVVFPIIVTVLGILAIFQAVFRNDSSESEDMDTGTEE